METPEKPVVNEETAGFAMDASTSGMVFVNSCGFIVGGILLFVLLLMRGLYLLPVFLVMLGILGTYMLMDSLVWKKNGIRRVEVDETGITLYRGKEKKPERLEAEQITGVNVFGKLNRRVVNILTGGSATRIPGVTIFSGPRVRITNDAFNDSEFDTFIKIIRRFDREPS